MSAQEIDELLRALNAYTTFFLILIVLCFAAFVALLASLVKIVKSRRNLQENRQFLSEIIRVQEKERRRISQELHDTISQNIKLALLFQKELLPNLPANLQDELERIIALEKNNQKELRAIIRNLSMQNLDCVSFKSVVADLCVSFQDESGIPCTLFVAPEADADLFTIEQKHHILRIIREALSNARIHSGASQAGVILRKTAQTIVIIVFDDGTGIRQLPHGEQNLHFGMSGMQIRAELLNGTLAVKSSPDTGTQVRLEIPIPDAAK